VLLIAVIVVQGALASADLSLRKIAATGFLFGIAALIRPIAIGIVAPTALALFLGSRSLPSRGRWLRCAVLAGAFAITIAPWEAWVWLRSDRVIPLSTVGPCAVLYGYAVGSGTDALPGWLPLAPSFGKLAAEAEHLPADQDCGRGVVTLLSTWARERPWELTKALGEKALRAWYGTDVHWFERDILLFNAAFAIVTMFGIVVAWRSGSQARAYTTHVLLLTGYFWGMTFVVESLLRYMLPAIILLCPLTALGLLHGLDIALRRGASRRREAMGPLSASG
jgi:hypothetical protein